MDTDTGIDEDVEIPEAEPLPPIDAAEEAATPPALTPRGQGSLLVDGDQDEAEPPPLPPLLELAGSNLATTGGLAYGAAGPAGLLAVGAVATVGAVAYMARSSRKKKEAAARRAARGGRFSAGRGGGRGGLLRGGLGRTAGTGRSSRAAGAGGLFRRARAGTGAGGARGLGRGRAGAASGGLAGRAGAGRGGSLLGARGGRSGAGLGRVGRAGGSGAGLAGRAGGGRSGGPAGRGLGGSSLRAPRISGGRGAGGFGGGRGRGLFGGRRPVGKVTTITDPAMRAGARRRPLRGAFKAARRGWNHPRVRMGRVRIRRASVRTRDYMRKRIRRLKAQAFFQRLAGWWSRLWGRVRGDDRYGPMWTATASASALSVALFGASARTTRPRAALTGRRIGTSARTPGEITTRDRLAIGAGDTSAPLEGHVMRKPGEIIRAETAADEMRAALAGFGSADVHMLTYLGGLEALPGILRTIGAGLSEMSSIAEGEQPLHPAVLQYMHQVSAAVHQVSQVAEEIGPLFRAAHETEIQRLQAPRAGEHRWDARGRDD